MKCKRLNEVIELLQPAWQKEPDLNLLTCEWAPMWVVDFPMFEENEDGSFSALHHPLTAPKC